MLRRVALLFALLAFLVPGVTRAQTVDEIVAKSIASHGGAAKLKSVKTLRLSGTMSIGPMEVPIVVEQKRPNMIRLSMNVQGADNVPQAYDGQSGWQYLPVQGQTAPQPLGEQELKEIRDDSEMDPPFMDYKARGHQVELMGKETVAGTETYKLKVTLKSGAVRYYYLDTVKCLPMKEEATRVVNGVEAKVETAIGDYRDEAGMMMPHRVESRVGDLVQTVTLQKVEVNPPIDDARFKMPVK